MRLPLRVIWRSLFWVSGALSACGCAGSRLEPRFDSVVPAAGPDEAPVVVDSPPSVPSGSESDADPDPPMNLGFTRRIRAPLPWRRHSISLGYIGDWPLRSAPAPDYSYASRPFSCGNCDPDFLLP